MVIGSHFFRFALFAMRSAIPVIRSHSLRVIDGHLLEVIDVFEVGLSLLSLLSGCLRFKLIEMVNSFELPF
jgi:hypothetical protein